MSGPLVYEFNMYQDVSLAAFMTTDADSNVAYSPIPVPSRVAMTIRRPLTVAGLYPLEPGNTEIVPMVSGVSGIQDYINTGAEGLGIYSGMIRIMIPASYFRVPGVYQIGFETTGALNAIDGAYLAQDNPSYMAPIILNIRSDAQATKGVVVRAASATTIRVSGLPNSDDDNHWSRCYLRMASGALVPQYSKIATSVMLFQSLAGAAYQDTGDVNGNYVVTAGGHFADYVWQAGDRIRIFGGDGLTAGFVGIAARISDDKIQLSASIGTSTLDTLYAEALTEIVVTSAFTSAPADDVLVVVVAE